MKHMNALQLRQSLGHAVADLQKTGEPIMLEKGKRPVAVIISLQDFQERFADKAASEARRKLMAEINASARLAVDKTPAEVLTRELRGGI